MVHPIMALVVTVIVIFVGIYAVTQVVSSVVLPTVANPVSNESINFAANDTYYSFANQATCLDDNPLPTNCGVTSGNVISVMNDSVVLTSGNYSYTTSQIKLLINDATEGSWNTTVGTYKVTYDYYDYQVSGSGSTLQTTQTTWWNAIQLGAVSLITVAASLVLGSFFLGK